MIGADGARESRLRAQAGPATAWLATTSDRLLARCYAARGS